MSLPALFCPHCGEEARPVPLERWHHCPHCGEPTRFDNLIPTHILRHATGGGGQPAAAAPAAPTLRETLWWAANPGTTLTDNSGSGSTETRTITSAEAHDSSDATYEELTCPGDGLGSEGDATIDIGTNNALTTASTSPISFIRIIARGKVTRTAGTGTATGSFTLKINSIAVGALTFLQTTLITTPQDFTTDPADGLPWTAAKINAKKFGLILACLTGDDSTTAVGAITEFTVQVWG